MNSIDIRKPIKDVSKGWGKEVWIVNNKEYCGKILKFNKDSKFSMHYHIEKEETFFVSKGKLLLKSINLQNADEYSHEINSGDVVDIPRFAPHQLIALEDSEIIEFSTHHEDSDSYRIAKGDSQK
jgi:mannose-6-phosphate isomerase-like protein (cupin superfamily)